MIFWFCVAVICFVSIFYSLVKKGKNDPLFKEWQFWVWIFCISFILTKSEIPFMINALLGWGFIYFYKWTGIPKYLTSSAFNLVKKFKIIQITKY